MKNRLWNQVLESPVIVVPLFGFGLGLAFLPFLVAGTANAASFYGSFAAAIVAAVAVILGASYQAHLTHKHDEELRMAATIAEATELFLWLANCVTRLERAVYRLDEFANRYRDGFQSQLPLNFASFRIFLLPIPAEEAAAQLSKLSKFPIDLGLEILSAIGLLADEYSVRNPAIFQDNLPINENDFRHHASACGQVIDLFKFAQAQIALVMQERFNAQFPIPTDIEEVAKRVQARGVGK